MKILHLVSLDGDKGEYGGPTKVAREICAELIRRGHQINLVYGVFYTKNSIEFAKQEYSIPVRPIFKNLPFSSLWSIKLPRFLFKHIKNSDIAHIHLGRESIPILAAIFCIILKIPFVTQTHGMITSDKRLATRLIDVVFIRYILKKASFVFVLHNVELEQITKLGITGRFRILPNGIATKKNSYTQREKTKPRVVFCARLHKLKHPELFVRLAKEVLSKGNDIEFIVYGPDGGELNSIKNEIKAFNNHNLKYCGFLPPSSVTSMLTNADLLILPSENDNFPMVVLESLSVGTPVIMMPSCRISKMIKDHFPYMICDRDNLTSLIKTFDNFLTNDFFRKNRKIYSHFCEDQFGIESVVNKLEQFYKEMKF